MPENQLKAMKTKETQRISKDRRKVGQDNLGAFVELRGTSKNCKNLTKFELILTSELRGTSWNFVELRGNTENHPVDGFRSFRLPFGELLLILLCFLRFLMRFVRFVCFGSVSAKLVCICFKWPQLNLLCQVLKCGLLCFFLWTGALLCDM